MVLEMKRLKRWKAQTLHLKDPIMADRTVTYPPDCSMDRKHVTKAHGRSMTIYFLNDLLGDKSCKNRAAKLFRIGSIDEFYGLAYFFVGY